MASDDESTYRSQFMILMRASPDLDGEQVVFGKVVDGVDVISRVEQMVGNGLMYLRIPVAELENTLEKQKVSCEMGYGMIRIGKSMELQVQLMTSLTTHRAVEHSVVARDSEGDGAGHGIPEEQ
ncbi:hypothetical protein YC2023_068521 [Brassica napus]